MNIRFRYIIVVLLCLVISCEKKPKVEAFNELSVHSQLSEVQDSLIYSYSKLFPNRTELAIAFIENDSTFFKGVVRLNDTIRNVTNHKSVFEIGSITKVFTSTLLAHAVTEGRINLSDSVAKKTSIQVYKNKDFTFEQLANHTSGLPRIPDMFWETIINFDNPYQNFDSTKLLTYLKEKLILPRSAGTKYSYSNLGAGILGFSLGRIYQLPYSELVELYFTKRYKMFSTTARRSKVHSNLVQALDDNGENTSNWDLASLEGAGAILSTVEDLSMFIHAQFDSTEKALKLTRTSTFTIDDAMDIGLGWHIIKRKDGSSYYWHNGATGGYSSTLFLDTELKRAVVILSNVSGMSDEKSNIDKLGSALYKSIIPTN